MLPKTEILLLKRSFQIKEINSQEKYFKHKKTAFNKFYFYLAVSNFFKLISYYQIQQFVYKNFVLENLFLMVSAIKEFIIISN